MSGRRPAAGIRAGFVATWILLLGATPCLAQVTGRVRPGDGAAAQYGTVSISVEVDLGSTGELLGSYGTSLTWDTSVLSYQSDTGGGEPPFDAAVVNRSNTAAGEITFGDASATGLGGHVNVFNVTFQVIASPLSFSPVDLEFTSMYAAETFENLSPLLTIEDGTITVTDFFFNLEPTDGTGTLFSWNAIPGAIRYDLIRTDADAIFDDGVTTSLGTVVCIEDDSADTTTAAGAEPAGPDNAVPTLGTAFVYLVRFRDLSINRTYGYSHPLNHERIPDSGDCP